MRPGGISPQRADKLRPRLDAFLARAPSKERVRFDPVEFPHRYTDPRDIEVSGLLSAALAYGRADLFRPKLDVLLKGMGASPAHYVRDLTLPKARRLLDGFVYRFNLPADIAVLLFGMQQALKAHGSLEALFAKHLAEKGSTWGALAGLTQSLRNVPMAPIRAALGPERGLHHLLPAVVETGAAKRLNLYLRWMVRGPDEVDFGIWKSIPPSALLIPLDTHIFRIARRLGLTTRKTVSAKTVEEISASLRRMDPDDPIKYDFALCHYGMSGVCPVVPVVSHCARCLLRDACPTGTKTVAKHRGLPR